VAAKKSPVFKDFMDGTALAHLHPIPRDGVEKNRIAERMRWMPHNNEVETGTVSPTTTAFGMVRWARGLTLGTGVALGTFGLAAGTANATPYAFGNLLFTNVLLTGLEGGTVTGSGVLASDSSSYPGFPNGGGSQNGTLTGGADVPQATSGPGTFPGENTYSPALIGGGTRGDSILFGNLTTGNPAPGASLVAEGRLLSGDSAASTAGTTTGFNLTVALDQTTTLRLTFGATSSLLASTTGATESASAQTNASFKVQAADGTVVANYVPDPVNQNVFSAAGGPNGTFNVASFAGDSGAVVLAPGTYNISLLAGVQERLSIGTAPPVPEPGTLALVGTAILGLGVLRSRRK